MRASVKILLDAVQERGLEVKIANGRAVLHGNPDEATPELIAAMKHFRAEILEALSITENTPPPPDEESEDEKIAPEVPDGAVIVVSDASGYTDRNMKGQPYMWCWIDGPAWYYVKNFPVPKR